MANNSSLAVAVDIFTSPNQAFAALKERPALLLPITLLVVAYSAVSFVYMNAVDLPWLFETQLQASGAEMSEAEREQAVSAAANVSPMAYGAIGAVSTSAFILLFLFLVSLYYTGISFVTNDGIKLKQWYALVCWCTLPILLGIVATLVNLTAGDARFVAQEQMNPLSFGNLFAIDTTGATYVQRMLMSFDLSSIWAIALSVLGYQAWTRRSMLKSVVIVLGPLACIVAVGVLLTAI